MNKQELNDGHYFELMDRCNCTINHIESDIAEHPALDDENKEKIVKAIQLIVEVYSWSGGKYCELSSPQPSIPQPESDEQKE